MASSQTLIPFRGLRVLMLRGLPPAAVLHGLRHGTVPDSRALIMRLVIASYTSWLLILISPSGVLVWAGGSGVALLGQDSGDLVAAVIGPADAVEGLAGHGPAHHVALLAQEHPEVPRVGPAGRVVRLAHEGLGRLALHPRQP